MKQFVLSLLLVSVPLLSRGSIPSPQPLAEAFADFEKAYPARFDELLADVRSRIGATKDEKILEQLEIAERYRSNLRADILEARHAFSDPKYAELLLFTLHKICTDLVGFRRSLDALVIEGSASKALTIDDAFLAKLRTLWEEEYYFEWRFRSEIDPSYPGPDESTQASETTPVGALR